MVEAMEAAGISSCLKHFPGYGGNADTHTGTAVDDRSLDTFRQEDFLPFQAGIDAGADAVLVSHNIVTAMDPDRPASLSPEVHRLLREELGFTGIVLTDALEMDAIQNFSGAENPAVLALQAGNDLILYRDGAAAYHALEDAWNAGTITSRQEGRFFMDFLGHGAAELGIVGRAELVHVPGHHVGGDQRTDAADQRAHQEPQQ